MDIQLFIIQYWEDVAKQKEEALKRYFYENAYIRWHDSNEQFNVNEFLRANCDYPGNWCGKVERIECLNHTVVTVTHVYSSDASFHVVSFFEIVDNKITSLDEYWGEDGDVPQWRKEKRIGKPIQ